MLKGWQAGRADLFKREKETFDKEFQRIKSIRENLRKDLDDYMKLLPYDKEAAMYKAEEITRKVGTNSIIAAYMAKQQPEMALTLLESAGKVIQHKEDKDAQMEIARMREGRADERARLQREQQLELARIKSAGAAVKVSEKTQKEIGENIVALKSLSDLSRMVDSIKDESGVFGAISGNVPLLAAQYYQSDAAKQTIAKLQEISAEKLKLLSGATVTVAEFARDRGFLPQRDDTPSTIQSKITNLYDAIRTETETVGKLRKLSDVTSAIESIPEPLYPSFRKAATKPKGPAVGEVKDGFRFKGGDPSQKESWEEVGSEETGG
jgi:hypothetical protein